jgi:glycosyltransferase involved in cell wall biosynthesis
MARLSSRECAVHGKIRRSEISAMCRRGRTDLYSVATECEGDVMTSLVSVVVTAYNHGPYIQETLRSVFAQTYSNFEVIVVDDGSTDDTSTKLQAVKDRILYVYQENQGVASSRNTGIQKTKGEFIALLDGDDLWEPEKLAIQTESLERSPRAGFAAVNGQEFDQHGVTGPQLVDRELIEWLASIECGPQGKDLSGSCYRLFLIRNRIATVSQVMFPRSVLERVGPSDSSFRTGSDYDLYLRILKDYELVVINESLTRWRYLPSSASGPREMRMLRWMEDDIKVLTKHLTLATAEDQVLLSNVIRAKRSSVRYKQDCHYVESIRDLDNCRPTDFTSKFRASCRLIAILKKRNVPIAMVISYLGGLWLPRRWVNLLRPRINKVLLR